MTDQEKIAVQNIIQDAGVDVRLVQNAVAAIKAGDKDALVGLLPRVVSEVKKDIADVQAALPVVKAGYKTTEFWLVVVAGAVTTFFQARGKPLPFDVVGAFAGLIAVYTAVRAMTKKPPTP